MLHMHAVVLGALNAYSATNDPRTHLLKDQQNKLLINTVKSHIK